MFLHVTFPGVLSSFHKLSGLADPTKVFFVIQMPKGYGKLGSRLDSRLPTTLPILHRLLESTIHLCHSPYEVCLFHAMYSFAFFACLRIGEITLSSSKGGGSPMQLHQLVQLVDKNQKVVALKCTFLDFKHTYNQRPFSLAINRQIQFCPVQLMLEYLALRGPKPGPVFILADGSAVTKTQFTEQLYIAFKYCGLDPSRYKGHSFRIGAASYAAEAGMSDTQIRDLGRWKSNAFQKYIRIPSLSY